MTLTNIQFISLSIFVAIALFMNGLACFIFIDIVRKFFEFFSNKLLVVKELLEDIKEIQTYSNRNTQYTKELLIKLNKYQQEWKEYPRE